MERFPPLLIGQAIQYPALILHSSLLSNLYLMIPMTNTPTPNSPQIPDPDDESKWLSPLISSDNLQVLKTLQSTSVDRSPSLFYIDPL